MKYSYSTSSLLITFYTTPHLNNTPNHDKGEINRTFGTHKDYYEQNVLKELYEKFRESLEEELQELGGGNKINDVHYKPHAYYIFGRFDLAVISLVESYDINTKSLHTNIIPSRFGHKLLAGVSPILKEGFTLENQAKQTFLKKKDRLPYIGICSLKLRNSLLIGSGASFMHCVMQYISLLAKTFDEKGKQKKKEQKKEPTIERKIEVIISETFSWNEITLLILSNSFEHMGEFIVKLRESYFENLKQVLEDDSLVDFSEKLEAVKRESLLSYWSQQVEPEGLDENLSQTSLFEVSSTQFGFDLYLFDKSDKKDELTKGEKDLDLMTRFITRPGHLEDAYLHVNDWIDDSSEINKVKVSFGNADFFIPSWEPFELDEKMQEESFQEHIANSYSTASIFLEKKDIFHKDGLQPQNQHQDWLEHYTYRFNISEAISLLKDEDKLESLLENLGVRKMLRERLKRNISNYNEGILNPVLYTYFIEIRPYLDQIESYIYLYEKEYNDDNKLDKELDVFCHILNDMVERFEIAYLNREHQSYNLLEVSDNNTKFSGGIQQLLTGIDAVYKIICLALGDKKGVHKLYKPQSLVFLTGFSGVSSFPYAMKINPMHVFYPAIFVAIATHEATNHFLEKIRSDQDFITFNHKGGEDLNTIYLSFGDYTEEQKEALRLNEDELKMLDTIENLDELLLQKIQKLLIEEEITEEEAYILKERVKEVRKETFEYLLSDLITFYLAYNQDAELFDFWHWHYFLQTPDNYSAKTEIPIDNFWQFLFRMILVNQVVDSNVYTFRMFSPVNVVQHYWDRYYNETQLLVDIVLSIDPLKNLCDDLHCLAQAVSLNAFYSNSETKSKVNEIKRSLKDTQEAFTSIYQNPDSFLTQTLSEIKVHLDQKTETATQKLAHGEIFPFQLSYDLNEKIQHVQALFLAYLKMLSPLDKNITNTLKFRWKGDDSNKYTFDKKWPSFLFDSQGGMMGSSANARKNMFKFTSAFNKSLWDIGIKEKIMLFKYYWEESKN